jgi:hypothetical protein
MLKAIKQTIITNEVDIRYFDRQKITLNDTQLLEVEKAVVNLKSQNESFKKKMEVIEDIIKELK